MPAYSRLQGVRDAKRPTRTSLVIVNLLDFFNWGCVQAGGFTNIVVADPGVASPGGDEVLTPVGKPGLADGRAWRTKQPNWCFETDLEDGLSPTRPAGVWVDGTYYDATSTTGEFAHHLDFHRGLVVFQTPRSLKSLVQIAHARRDAMFVDPGPSWFQRVVLGNSANDPLGPDGLPAVLEDNHVQVPVVVAESAGVHHVRGHQLGGSARRVVASVLLHVLADNDEDRDRLTDVIVDQYNKTILMYDLAARRAAGDFPLDARGSLRPDASQYPQLPVKYPHAPLHIRQVSSIIQPSIATLRLATCRLDVELIAATV